ncbi:MAG TPA: hypothetical protein DEF18_09620 [Muricauda sp.]|uniref:Uncharacterized protein n=1 Tax=Flagellimonas aurea TaxID=2915619 RepID=A0ABS3G042_9FLAO|nr:hypothetical protein [Allomuricauda aurea]MAO17520.1 hypothetical protein [Allomuricauda sp.]MBO0352760.1 hypothetical protein [Allomuricauda aurea]HBU78348.1 hypothetical protein [Allomuricauda sp.]|tara:strand:+ start:206 stop:544 length:339 start_codon:yes stop_codon:yes gene_type:complete
MKNLRHVLIILFFPILIFGQEAIDTPSDANNEVLVYVYSKSNITLNGNKISIKKLDKYLEENHLEKAKIGTMKPTPMKVFPTFEKVVGLMEKHKINVEWYRDPEFQIPFFED